MKMKRAKKGFSLAEVLMATGVLALGLAFIAGVFPAGMQYAIVSTERTMAAVVADEAFAKVRLYGVDVNSTGSIVLLAPGSAEFLTDSSPAHVAIFPNEFGYPSAADIPFDGKTYFWSAICRRVSGVRPSETLVQVTVFVSRKTLANLSYYGTPGNRPVAVPIPVSQLTSLDRLQITNSNDKTKIMVGSTIVDDISGKIYRVIERVSDNQQGIILDKSWEGQPPVKVWVVPPPASGGRYPCVGVFQKEILF